MNLKGGYKIIDLMTLSLVAVTTGLYTDITDKTVLEQLLSLHDLMDTSKELKPIFLRVGQSTKEVVMAELLRDSAGLHIHALLDGYTLDIKVTYQVDEDTQEVLIDDAQYLYVENSAQEEAVIKGLIEADKDILSRIIVEYDETSDNTTIIFPKYIIPIKFYLGGTVEHYCYFNYKDGILVVDDSTSIDTSMVGSEEDSIKIVIEGEFSISEIGEILYINASNIDSFDSTLYFNTYYIFNPITSGGTKLYKHLLDLRNSSDITVARVFFISTSNETSSLSSFAPANAYYVSIKGELINTYKLTISGVQYYPLIPDFKQSGSASGREVGDATFSSTAVDISSVTNIKTETITEL